jgi:hypothetical protein
MGRKPFEKPYITQCYNESLAFMRFRVMKHLKQARKISAPVSSGKEKEKENPILSLPYLVHEGEFVSVDGDLAIWKHQAPQSLE